MDSGKHMVSQTKQIQLAGELFEAVQKKKIFSDCKQFLDMVPKDDPERIFRLWKKLKDEPIFDLKTFVHTYFEKPEEYSNVVNINRKKVCREHISSLWNVLFRKPDKAVSSYDSLIPLPHPYVVSGGNFREVYYWESYFMAQGLRADGHEKMILNMVHNFTHLIKKFGYVPGGNRVYLTDRSQPPFYTPLAEMGVKLFGDDLLSEVLPAAEKEYNFWMDKDENKEKHAVSFSVQKRIGPEDKVQTSNYRLNRYWSDQVTPRQEHWNKDLAEAKSYSGNNKNELYRNIRAASESGWDLNSRWLTHNNGRKTVSTTDILPVDLNTLLWYMEKKISEWNFKTGKDQKAREFERRAYQRKKSIIELMWGKSEGFFFDYNLRTKKRTEHWTLAVVYPLYFGLATKDQATKIASHLERRFLKKGGLVTSLQESGLQWDAPYGWAPLHWMAVVGLKNYGFNRLSDEITRRWMNLVDQVFQKTGKLVEKYNVIDLDRDNTGGDYAHQDGYGWTNGVYSALDEIPKE